VNEANAENQPHAWLGTEVIKTGAGFVDKPNARLILVRKAASRVVATIR
jgi:hypothetical protein